jgi:TonB family protein
LQSHGRAFDPFLRRRSRTAFAAVPSVCLSLALALSFVSRASPVRAQDFEQATPPNVPAPAPRAPQLTKAPAIKKNAAPVYPPQALAAGLSADVPLMLDLDAAGVVTAARVTQPAGNGFDEAATAAALAMEFTPAEIDGKPAAIRIEYVLHFRPHVEAADGGVPTQPDGGGGTTAGGAAEAGATDSGAAEPAPPVPPTVILRGRVRQKGTREAVAGAAVMVIDVGAAPGGGDSPARQVATTDDTGAYELALPEAAQAQRAVRVVVTGAGIDPCLRDLSAEEIRAAALTPIAWSCYARAVDQVYQTRVRAVRPANDVTRHSLSAPELTTVPGTFGDPLRVLQNLPGVSRAPYGLGLLIVRGAPPTDTGVFVGGQSVPRLYHFLIGPAVIAPHLIERIDFYPGGFGVRHGRSSGGAVDVSLKEGSATGFHGGADLSVLDASAFAEGPLYRGRGREGDPALTSATVALRRSTIDAILPLVVPRQQGSTFVTTVPVYWDYQARLVHDFGDARRGRMGVMAFGAIDSLKVVTQDAQAGNFDLNSRSSFHRVVAFWTGRLGDWTARLSPAYGNGEDAFTLGGTSGSIRYQRGYLRADVARPLGTRAEVRLGFDGLYSYDTGNFNIDYPREGRNFGTATLERQRAVRALIDWGPAVFVESELRPHPSLRIVPGLRFDAYHVVGQNKSNWDPRLSIRWSPRAPWTFKAGAGIYHQLPTGQFLDGEFGNQHLKLIWADQYAVGVERPLGTRLNLDVTAYYLRRHDLPVPSFEHFSSTGRGRGWGLEVLLKHEVTAHVFGWLAYTLSWTQQTGASAEEMISGTADPVLGGGDTRWRPSAYDQRHNLIAVGSYRRWGWQFGARYRLVSGRPTTVVDGSFYDSDFGGYTPTTSSAARTSPGRLPTFNQLDLRVERTFTFDVWTLGAYLDVQNVFNAQNPENFIYDYRYRQRAPVRGLPILPVIGLRGRF